MDRKVAVPANGVRSVSVPQAARLARRAELFHGPTGDVLSFRGRKPTNARDRRRQLFAMALVVPAMVYFTMWVFVPAAYGAYLSLTNASLLSPPQFVGLLNYRSLLSSSLWRSTIVRTILYTAEVVIPTLLLSFIMARLLTRIRRGRTILMAIYFLPYIIPAVVAALIFMLFFQLYGIVNTGLHIQVAWLTDPGIAMYALSIATIWTMLGYYVVIFLAGYQQLPADLTEAARIDGAGVIQLVRFVELPVLRPTVIFCVLTSVAGMLTNFTMPYVMTNGGPADATLTAPLLIYKEAFKYSSAGLSEAMAMALLIATVALTGLLLGILRAGRKS